MPKKTPEQIQNEVLAEFAHLPDTDETDEAMAHALLKRLQLYGYKLEVGGVTLSPDAIDHAQSDYENAQFDHPELDL